MSRLAPLLTADLPHRSVSLQPLPFCGMSTPPTPPRQGTGIWFPHSSPAQNNRDATPSPLRGCGRLEGPPRREWCSRPLPPRGPSGSLPPLPPELLLLGASGACQAAERWASRVQGCPEETTSSVHRGRAGQQGSQARRENQPSCRTSAPGAPKRPFPSACVWVLGGPRCGWARAGCWAVLGVGRPASRCCPALRCFVTEPGAQGALTTGACPTQPVFGEKSPCLPVVSGIWRGWSGPPLAQHCSEGDGCSVSDTVAAGMRGDQALEPSDPFY